MKLVIQRVKTASVTIENKVVSKIDRGLLVFLGISVKDDNSQIDWLTRKLVNLRIFEDNNGKMNLSVKDINGEILLVSQFTLYANALRGNRPDFLAAAKPEKAIPLYEEFIRNLSKKIKVQTGKFGADMKVALVNDGPVTIILEK